MGSVSNLCNNHTIQTSQSRCWVEVGVMSYLSCLLWKLTTPDKQWCWEKIARERSSPGHHLGLAPGMTVSSFSPSHVGSVGCWAGPYLSQQPNHAASWQKEEDLCCLHLHLESIQAGLSDVVKTYGQQAILKSWRNLSWTLRRIKSLHPIWWSHCSFSKSLSGPAINAILTFGDAH